MAQTYAICFSYGEHIQKHFTNKAFYKVQTPVGQRIKFLLEHYNLSARNFSKQLGVAENNTQNYIRDVKPAIPNADYLERIMLHFKSINPVWLLTGQGDPFLPEASEASGLNQTNIKNNSGVGVSHGSTNTFIKDLKIDDCRRELEASQKEIASLRRELELQAALLAAKEETITLLRASYNRPN